MLTISKVLKTLSSVPHDKLLHAVYGMCTYYLAINMVEPVLAISVVVLVAFGKEAHDEYVYGGFDWKDMVATILIPILLFITEYL